MIKPIETNSSSLRYLDLEKQIWREIRTLSDIRIIKEKIKSRAKVSGEPMTDSYAEQKAKDIQYCIKQAYDYFYSSKSATLVIKPTLIYYGLISLSAALIILKVREKSLNSMKEAHGLKDKYPTNLNNLEKGSISKNDILLISAEIQESGTFCELLSMDLSEAFIMPIKLDLKNDSSKDFSQKMNFRSMYPTLKDITLLNLFQNIPEIWKEAKISLKKDSFAYMGEAVLKDEVITCRISKELNTIENIKNNFAFANSASYAESNDYHFLSIRREDYINKTPLTKRDIIGNQYLIADKNNPLISSDYLLYYLTFFILGSLARYKPALWRYILEDPLHGLNTIPEILCESAYIKLPLHFLSEFNDNFYKI